MSATHPLKPAPFQFVRSREPGAPNGADDPRLALLAACVCWQQQAGFGTSLDLRQFTCDGCGAPGFNTGWGYLRFTCGAEIVPGAGHRDPECGAVPSDTTVDAVDVTTRLRITQRELARERTTHRLTHGMMMTALADNLAMRQALGLRFASGIPPIPTAPEAGS